MKCRIENGVVYTHTYNAENRASSIAKRNTDCTGTIIESWSFAYDGDGVRVSTAHFTGTSGSPDSTTSYFMGGQFEVKDGGTKKYYSIAGMMVAVNDGSAVQYLLTDHLGSTVAVTDSSGTLTSQQRYLPFGGERAIPNSPILATDFGYTGQRMLDSGMGGIMDYKARFYSPVLGRFLQPDTIIPDQSNPQIWNRFTYVGNNPVNHNDPDGRCYPVCTAVIGAALGAMAGAAIYTATNHGNSFDAGEFWASVAVGTASGALIGTGAGIGAGTALGATLLSGGIGMGASAAGYTLTAGKNYNKNEMAANAGIGLVSGLATGYVGGLSATTFIDKALMMGLKLEISIGSGLVQQAVGDLYDTEWSTTEDFRDAAASSTLAFTYGELGEAFFPTYGKVINPLLRAIMIETGNNWLTNELKRDNRRQPEGKKNSYLEMY